MQRQETWHTVEGVSGQVLPRTEEVRITKRDKEVDTEIFLHSWTSQKSHEHVIRTNIQLTEMKTLIHKLKYFR